MLQAWSIRSPETYLKRQWNSTGIQIYYKHLNYLPSFCLSFSIRTIGYVCFIENTGGKEEKWNMKEGYHSDDVNIFEVWMKKY